MLFFRNNAGLLSEASFCTLQIGFHLDFPCERVFYVKGVDKIIFIMHALMDLYLCSWGLAHKGSRVATDNWLPLP